MIKFKTANFIFLILAILNLACFADTFTNRKTNEILHGYITSQTVDNNTVVQTPEKGLTNLNLAEWTIAADRNGRNNKVVVLTLNGPILLEIETAAFEKAIARVSGEGPLFVLLEIDTPGGDISLAQRICAAITKAGNCQVIGFVKGGEFGGALSAGAAVAFACSKIYMANNTVIGAAAVIALDKKGPKSMKDKYGEDIGEKFSSAWRGYMASLAEHNNRPGLLARAMVDKGIEVIEVKQEGKRIFIDPVNKKERQEVVHTWNKKGSLLTLTASEAVNCEVADKVVDSRGELLSQLDAADAELVVNTAVQDAGREFEKVKLKCEGIEKSLDLKFKEIENSQTSASALKLLREIKSDVQTVIKFANEYPDLHVDVQKLEELQNSVEAEYKDVKTHTRRRK